MEAALLNFFKAEKDLSSCAPGSNDTYFPFEIGLFNALEGSHFR